ncbi:MAG TPA: hypothetical protein VGE58_07685 [Daejeonella sp.]
MDNDTRELVKGCLGIVSIPVTITGLIVLSDAIFELSTHKNVATILEEYDLAKYEITRLLTVFDQFSTVSKVITGSVTSIIGAFVIGKCVEIEKKPKMS